MAHVGLAPNNDFDFIQSENMKFAYTWKLYHMPVEGTSHLCNSTKWRGTVQIFDCHP